MHRALSSLACVWVFAPGCGDATTAPSRGGGQGGSGGVVDSSTSGDVDDEGRGPDSSSGGSAAGASGGGGTDAGSSSGGEDAPAACGDGILDADELCDDGNLGAGDGCEADCTTTIGVETFSVGGAHTCAVSFEGEVRCFGSNTFGQLGIGSTETIGDDETPASAEASVQLPAVVQISAGARHTCAVTEAGEVMCWGANDRGQLGLGHTKTWGDDPPEAPVAVPLGAEAVVVVAGASHSCALLRGGEVRCWGLGVAGQLGLGDDFAGTVGAGEGPYPEVSDAPAVPFGAGVTLRALASGRGDHTCGLDAFGDVYCWGEGADGRLGTGDIKPVGLHATPGSAGPIDLPAPARALALSTRHTCVADVTSGLLCFGANAHGELGQGHTETIGDDERVDDAYASLGALGVRAAGLTDRASCALLNDATVRCWGDADRGQTGYGTTERVGDDEVPGDWDGFGPLKLLEAATAIEGGEDHLCARTSDARLRCWGVAADGRLGLGTTMIDAWGDDVDETIPRIVHVFE